MKTRILFVILLLVILFIGFFSGLIIAAKGENLNMGKYDLYQCIYNNADNNGFTQNTARIEKIQQECLCIKMTNYTRPYNQDCLEEVWGW